MANSTSPSPAQPVAEAELAAEADVVAEPPGLLPALLQRLLPGAHQERLLFQPELQHRAVDAVAPHRRDRNRLRRGC